MCGRTAGLVKRLSDEDLVPDAKRRQSLSVVQDLVDDIPVYSKQRPSRSLAYPTLHETQLSSKSAAQTHDRSDIGLGHETSSVTRSFASTRQSSFVSDGSGEYSTSPSSQGTIPFASTCDHYPADQETIAALEQSFTEGFNTLHGNLNFNESWTEYDQQHVPRTGGLDVTYDEASTMMEDFLETANLLDDDGDDDDYDDDDSFFNSLAAASIDGDNDPNVDRKLTVEEQLQTAWPRLRAPGLINAPLGILWEITRAANHCDVLTDVDLTYAEARGWHDQARLRSALLATPYFRGLSLPPSSNSKAWEVALDSFQSGSDAVVMSATMVVHKSRKSSSIPTIGFRLEPLRLEQSHRLIRRFGADRFLELNIQSPDSKEDDADFARIMNWLVGKPHYFVGRVWKPFFMKRLERKERRKLDRFADNIDHIHKPKKKVFFEKVYMFAIDGDCFRPTAGLPPPHTEALDQTCRMKFGIPDLLEWALQISHESNWIQPYSKLFSRLSLNLSRSFHTVILTREQIRIRPKDLGTDQVMNDGAGRMSKSLAQQIAACLELTNVPCAFQGRIGSAKGMWFIDTADNSTHENWIELFPSQIKWNCDFEDLCHRTFQVKSWPKRLTSASLNGQLIPILQHCAVNYNDMRDIVADRLKATLASELDGLKEASQDAPALRLWASQSGDPQDRRLYTGYCQFTGGLPQNNENALAFLLDQGFDPKRSKVIKEMAKSLADKKTEDLRTRMSINVPCSTYAYMLPDFTGTLEVGEVHFCFSDKFDVTGFSDTGLDDVDILVSRLPAHLPSDIQKVRAVYRKELRHLKDVIIFSTKGTVPLADKLSGGDYDGDRAWVCFDPMIVDNFRNAEDKTRTPDFFENGHLTKDIITFGEIKGDRDALDWTTCHEFLQRSFGFSAHQDLLGFCTNYKEKLCYHQNRIDTEGALALSVLLGHLVDRAKQGIIFTWEHWHRIRKDFVNWPAKLDQPQYENRLTSSNHKETSKWHIRDYLKFVVAANTIDSAYTELEALLNVGGSVYFDEDLIKFHMKMEKLYAGSKSIGPLFTYLDKELLRCEQYWFEQIGRQEEGIFFAQKVDEVYHRYAAIRPPVHLRTAATVGWLADDVYHEHPHFNKWELLKASALHRRNQHRKFPYWIAGRQLGLLKLIETARREPSDTSSVAVTPAMWASLKPNKKYVQARLVAQQPRKEEQGNERALEELVEMDDDGTVMDDC